MLVFVLIVILYDTYVLDLVLISVQFELTVVSHLEG